MLRIKFFISCSLYIVSSFIIKSSPETKFVFLFILISNFFIKFFSFKSNFSILFLFKYLIFSFIFFEYFFLFNNKYSFCKILRKLQRLEKKYEDIEKIYNEYLNHKKNDEKEADFVDGIYDEVIKTREEEIIKDKSFSPVFSNYVKKETSKGKALVRSLSRNNK